MSCSFACALLPAEPRCPLSQLSVAGTGLPSSFSGARPEAVLLEDGREAEHGKEEKTWGQTWISVSLAGRQGVGFGSTCSTGDTHAVSDVSFIHCTHPVLIPQRAFP